MRYFVIMLSGKESKNGVGHEGLVVVVLRAIYVGHTSPGEIINLENENENES